MADEGGPGRSRADPAPGLLVVNNAPFQERDGRIYVEPPTGRFLEELAERVPDLATAQGASGFDGARTQNTYDLAASIPLCIESLPWNLDGTWGSLSSYLRAVPWVIRLVWRARWLYVFLPGHLPMLFVVVARLLRRPYGIYLRGELGEKWLERGLSAARFVLAANERMRQNAARYCDETALVAPMLPLSANDIASPRPPRADGPWRILFVGRVEEAKGVGELLEAVALVQGRGLDVSLDLVGWALEGDHYQHEAERKGIEGARFHGIESDPERLGEHYAGADLFVLPTHHEGFPRVLYEAMAYGVPALTTFVGGIPEVMRDGENCLRVPPRDPAGLAAAIERALSDTDLRARIAAGGTATISEVLAAGHPTHADRLVGELTRCGYPAPADRPPR